MGNQLVKRQYLIKSATVLKFIPKKWFLKKPLENSVLQQ